VETMGQDVLCDFPSFYKPHKHQQTISGRVTDRERACARAREREGHRRKRERERGFY